MQGVILDEMRQFVANRYGYRAWIETLRRAGHEPTYRYELNGVYPDDELGILARNAAEVTETPPLTLLKDFGQAMVPDMMRVYAYLVDRSWSYADFLLHMEPILEQALQVHTPGATSAKVHAERLGKDLVQIDYDSPLRACAAVEGVMLGAAREYGVTVAIKQDQCVLRGAHHCTFTAQIGAPSPAA